MSMKQEGTFFHQDLIKIAMLDKVHSLKLDQSIVKAISECSKCKNFGSTHLNALLQPIMLIGLKSVWT